MTHSKIDLHRARTYASVFAPGHGNTWKQRYKDVCPQIATTSDLLPIVYSKMYNISLLGLEKLHPFDSCKFEKIIMNLKAANLVREVRTRLCNWVW
jgi:hypothetical protein